MAPVNWRGGVHLDGLELKPNKWSHHSYLSLCGACLPVLKEAVDGNDRRGTQGDSAPGRDEGCERLGVRDKGNGLGVDRLE